MNRLLSLLNFLLCFELVIGPFAPNLSLLRLQDAKAESCSAGMQFDSQLNRCLTSNQSALVMNAVSSCGSGDAAARKACYESNAEAALSRDGTAGTDRQNVASEGKTFGVKNKDLTFGAAAVAIGASTAAIWAGYKAGVPCKAYSTYAMLVGGVALGAGEYFTNRSHRSRLKENQSAWEDLKVNEDGTARDASAIQGEAFEFMAKNEDSMKTASGQKKIAFGIAAVSFATSAVMATLEWTQLRAAKKAYELALLDNKKQFFDLKKNQAIIAPPLAVEEAKLEMVKIRTKISKNDLTKANYLNNVLNNTCFQSAEIRDCRQLREGLAKINTRAKRNAIKNMNPSPDVVLTPEEQQILNDFSSSTTEPKVACKGIDGNSDYTPTNEKMTETAAGQSNGQVNVADSEETKRTGSTSAGANPGNTEKTSGSNKGANPPEDKSLADQAGAAVVNQAKNKVKQVLENSTQGQQSSHAEVTVSPDQRRKSALQKEIKQVTEEFDACRKSGKKCENEKKILDNKQNELHSMPGAFMKKETREIKRLLYAKTIPQLLNRSDKIRFKHIPSAIISEKEYRKKLNLNKRDDQFILHFMKKFIIESFGVNQSHAQAERQHDMVYLRAKAKYVESVIEISRKLEAEQVKAGMLMTSTRPKLQSPFIKFFDEIQLINHAYANGTCTGKCFIGGYAMDPIKSNEGKCVCMSTKGKTEAAKAGACDSSNTDGKPTFKCGAQFFGVCIDLKNAQKASDECATGATNKGFLKDGKVDLENPKTRDALSKMNEKDLIGTQSLYCEQYSNKNDENCKRAADEHEAVLQAICKKEGSMGKKDCSTRPAPAPVTPTTVECAEEDKIGGKCLPKPKISMTPSKFELAPIKVVQAQLPGSKTPCTEKEYGLPGSCLPKNPVPGCDDLEGANGTVPKADQMFTPSTCTYDPLKYVALKSNQVEGNKIMAFIRNPGTRAVMAGVLTAWSTTLTVWASKSEKDSKERAGKLREVKDSFQAAAGAIYSCAPADRNDPAKPNCYCYGEDNKRNMTRAESSDICKNLFSSKSLKASNYAAKATFGAKKICVASSGSADDKCACRATNTCLKATPNNSAFSTGNFAMLGKNLNPIDSIGNGTLAEGSVSAEGLVNNAARLIATADKLQKAEDANFGKNKDKLSDRFSGIALNAGAAMGVAAPLSGGGSLPESPAAAAKALESEIKDVGAHVESIGGGDDMNTPHSGTGDLAIPEEPGISQETEIAEVMNKDLDYGQNDINSSSSTNIFEVLSNRYRRSGMRRLFDDEGKTEAEKPSAEEINK